MGRSIAFDRGGHHRLNHSRKRFLHRGEDPSTVRIRLWAGVSCAGEKGLRHLGEIARRAARAVDSKEKEEGQSALRSFRRIEARRGRTLNEACQPDELGSKGQGTSQAPGRFNSNPGGADVQLHQDSKSWKPIILQGGKGPRDERKFGATGGLCIQSKGRRKAGPSGVEGKIRSRRTETHRHRGK